EGRIERVDTRVVEVGRVQTVVQEGEPVVDGALRGVVDHRHGGGAVDRRRPARDRAGLRVEHEPRRAAHAALADDERIRVRGGDGAGGTPGDVHRQGVL